MYSNELITSIKFIIIPTLKNQLKQFYASIIISKDNV